MIRKKQENTDSMPGKKYEHRSATEHWVTSYTASS
jgi:hypothetical protein